MLLKQGKSKDSARLPFLSPIKQGAKSELVQRIFRFHASWPLLNFKLVALACRVDLEFQAGVDKAVPVDHALPAQGCAIAPHMVDDVEVVVAYAGRDIPIKITALAVLQKPGVGGEVR
jgi:hypothetical protein